MVKELDKTENLSGKGKKQSNLRRKFVAYTGIVTAVGILLASVFSLILTSTLFWQDAQSKLLSSLDAGTDEISDWFVDKENLLTFISDDMRLFTIEDKEAVEDYLEVYGETYDFLVDAYLSTPDNRMYAGSRWQPDADYDGPTRDWYVKAKENDGIAYTAPYIDAESGQMVITVSRPIVDKEGTDMGVMALDLDLNSLVETVNGHQILNTPGTAFLMDETGQFITHENQAFLPTIEGEAEQFVTLEESGIVQKSVLRQKEIEADFDGALALSKGENYDDSSIYIGTSVVATNGWTYGFTVPVAHYYPEFFGIIGFIAAIGAALIIIMGVVVYFLTTRLLNPVQQIIDAANELSIGNVDVDLTIETGDELEDLANQFKVMQTNTSEQIDAMTKLSNGDFSAYINPKSDQDVLSITINDVIGRLEKVFEEIDIATEQLAVGSNEIADSSQSLAVGAAQQAEAVENLNMASENILNSVEENSKNADEVNALIGNIKEGAEQGMGEMRHMVGAVEEINTASNDISKVIGVIDEIAFQTNILALNAAVEAARAGEQGKGFAVVADEVRSLASRSAKATEETTALIESSVKKAADGVTIAHNTEKLLEGIVDNINLSVHSVSDIAEKSSQ